MKYLKRRTERILFALLMLLSCSTFYVKAQDTKLNYNRLITAIGTVESQLNDKAINGVHAGFLQISKVCVTECNRINQRRGVSTRYTLQDRFNRKKSIEMFCLIQSHYNPQQDIHYAVLLWNEGCSAMKKPKRQTKYYCKVMKVYNSL
jgi:hypothetical protein